MRKVRGKRRRRWAGSPEARKEGSTLALSPAPLLAPWHGVVSSAVQALKMCRTGENYSDKASSHQGWDALA